MIARRRALLLLLAGMLAAVAPVDAKVFLTQEEALKLAFGEAKIERKTVFLTPAQQDAAAKLSGRERPSALAVAYVATKDGRLVATAYFDSHVVRTQQETLMIVVDPSGAIARIEVLSFSEPEDYLPRGHWYGQFAGKTLNDELAIARAIRPVSGATLTARATTDASRRILALHAVLRSSASGAR